VLKTFLAMVKFVISLNSLLNFYLALDGSE
jgi:hypothetical protein